MATLLKLMHTDTFNIQQYYESLDIIIPFTYEVKEVKQRG